MKGLLPGAAVLLMLGFQGCRPRPVKPDPPPLSLSLVAVGDIRA